MIYLILIFEFFKIGLFAAGGGLATLPFLTALADKYPWLTSEMLSQMVAISESTPGPLGVNMATYAGYMAGMGAFAGSPYARLLSVTAAATATASLVAPSFIIILIVSRMLDRYKNSKLVANAFSGLRPAVAGLIAAACWSVLRISILDLTRIGEGFGKGYHAVGLVPRGVVFGVDGNELVFRLAVVRHSEVVASVL